MVIWSNAIKTTNPLSESSYNAWQCIASLTTYDAAVGLIPNVFSYDEVLARDAYYPSPSRQLVNAVYVKQKPRDLLLGLDYKQCLCKTS